MKKFKRAIKSKIALTRRSLGLEDLTSLESSGGFEAKSRFKFFRGAEVSVPFALGRTIRGVTFTKPELDPFSQSLAKQNIYEFDQKEFAKNLDGVLMSERDKTVRYFMDTLANEKLLDQPSWTIAFPWEHYSFTYLARHYVDLLFESRAPYSDFQASEKSLEKIMDEYAVGQAKQFSQLTRKLIDEGFSFAFDRPGVFILKNKDKWRWVMAGNGNHRAYIMYALKSANLPVSVVRVVDRSKAHRWPNVRNREYTPRDAEQIFDMVFEGSRRIRGCL